MKRAALIAILMMSCDIGTIDDLPDRKVMFWADNVDFDACGMEGVTVTVDGLGKGSIAKQLGFARMVTLDVWLDQKVHAYVVYSVALPGRERQVWAGEIPRGGGDYEIHICCGRSCEL